VRPETEGIDLGIAFEAVGPRTTRVTIALQYDDADLAEEGETFADVARRVDQDMQLFKAYAEGRRPQDRPAAAS